jgi:hypothetical protein
MGWVDVKTHDDFIRARRQALVAGLFDLLNRRSTDLLSFEEVRTRLNIRGQRDIGTQIVPVDRIIGSEGRYSDFDRRFLPRKDSVKNRWRSIDKAHYQEVILPPVELYKIDDVYFVKDGNHRVSVARQQGQIDLDAYVTELIVDVPLSADMSAYDLMLKEEYSDFLEWTDLHQLRPDERIEFTELGGYLDLVRHINAHRYYMGIERKGEVDRDEAVGHWYDTVYMPIIKVIREQNVLEHFPGRTEADLYRWIMDHRWYLRESTGEDPGPYTATMDYTSTYGRKGLAEIVGDVFDQVRSLFPWFNDDEPEKKP